MEENTSQQPLPVGQVSVPPTPGHIRPFPQRVIITGSMLYAYSAMRGNVDKGYDELDPLYSSLYLNPIRCVNPQFEVPIDIHHWQLHNDPIMAQELQHGSFFYHDVSRPLYPSQAPNLKPSQSDNVEPKPISYEDHKLSNPPESRANHYKGGEAYGNYGYFQVKGRWVDPESQMAIHEALNSRAPRVPDLPVGTTSIPSLYEDEIYSGFMDEVNSDGGDGEGDPRATHITPAIFARWAAGAGEGNYYLETKVGPQDLSKWRGRTRTRKPVPIRHPPTYCEKTGSMMSGDFTPEHSPSLCMSARGVNLEFLPGNFSYMSPQAAIDIERAAYGGDEPAGNSQDRVADWLALSTISGLIPFTEDAAVEYLADSKDPDPQTGTKKWNAYVDCINNLQGEYGNYVVRNSVKWDRLNEGQLEAQQLYKEAYFMEDRLNKRDIAMVTSTPRRTIARDMSRPTPSKPPQPKFTEAFEPTPTKIRRRRGTQEPYTDSTGHSNSQLEQTKAASAPFLQPAAESAADSYNESFYTETSSPESQPPAAVGASSQHHRTRYVSQSSSPKSSSKSSSEDRSSSQPPLRHKNQFERHFQEREEFERMKVNKLKVVNAQLDVNLKDILESIANLKVVHTKYRNSLGIESVSEIPDLIPEKRKKPDIMEEIKKKQAEQDELEKGKQKEEDYSK